MTIHSKIAELIATGDQIAAERLARDALAGAPADADAMHMLGIILRESGRTAEAISILEDAYRADPGKVDILMDLAHAQSHGGQILEACATFRKHAALSDRFRVKSMEEAAACQILAGNRGEASRILVEAGVMPEGIAFDPKAVMAAARSQRLGNRQAIAILRIMAKGRDLGARLILAQALWTSEDRNERAMAADELPNLLYVLGRTQEALEVYQGAVEQGFTVGDFRPKWIESSLAAADQPLAVHLYERDRDLFTVNLERAESELLRVWRPLVDSWGSLELRGVTPSHISGVSFELLLSAPGKPERTRSIAAEAARTTKFFTFWRAVADDLLPGQSLSIHVAADGSRSGPMEFRMPAADGESIGALAADSIGNDRAVLAATLVPNSPAARYRFEFGSDPVSLDRATDWKTIPPPRSGRAYQRLYRQVGEWLPTCVKAGWNTYVSGASAFAGSPSLLLGAPFAKDRNQLTGIGAHEMVAGICWSQPRPASSADFANATTRRICWPVGGGVLDLRDAEVSFTLCGRSLEQHGAALHFWIAHGDQDERGAFSSQWALTGAPFPDHVLDGSTLQKVVLALPNDPRAWTYTGNNPREQGPRADRYRRAPLDMTLGSNNGAFVFIFSFGDVRRPPTGDLVVYDAEVSYRDHSVLSHAAGAELTRFPVGAEDPLQLTSGARGYEDMLWTSASAPAFPLEFRWQLRQPVALSHFQVNQHPYWPTRDIQLLVEDAQGRQQVVWSGVLPEGRPDKREPSFVLHYFDEDVTTVSVILRVLSGYHTERCGLDSLELYGAGAAFTPDGTSCSLSSEIKDLTPGSTIYYRIVLDDGGESLESGLQAVSLPLTLAPIIESAAPLIRARNPACYAIRANAMGLETELWGELRLADGQVIEGQRISLGSQPTGRHIYYVPDGLPEAPGAIFHLCARNAAGDATLPARFPCR